MLPFIGMIDINHIQTQTGLEVSYCTDIVEILIEQHQLHEQLTKDVAITINSRLY
jgi:GTP cyclohydrolase I